MALKKYCIIALVAIMVLVLFVGAPVAVAQESSPEYTPGFHTGWMTESYTTYNGTPWSCDRTFKYYIPTGFSNSTAVPLLFSFHGLGSNGDEQIDLTRLDLIAEREGFIAVFPNSTNLDPNDPRWSGCWAAHGNWSLPGLTGSNIMWNCGEIEGIAISPVQECAGVDDVDFVVDMVDWFKEKYNIDDSQIFSTGMSNGAMFSYLLAFNLTGTFAGIAPVAAPMPLNLGWNATTPDPITVIVMRGDSDPIIPEAGECSDLLCNNFSYSTPDTIKYWCEIDGINMTDPGPVETVFGPTTKDSTVVHRYVYSGGTDGTQVILFWVVGGGHQWPGGPAYLEPLLGPATTHIDGSGQIWKYFPPVVEYCLRICTAYDGTINSMGGDHYAGVITAPGEGTFFYAPGSPPQTGVSLVATPWTGWSFKNWTGDTGIIASTTTSTTTMTFTPNRDYEIIANFETATPPPPPPPSGGCFIATAAYGTPTAQQLDVLRAFRDDVLLKSTLGSRLVDLYYQVSPPIADFISEHNFVRTLVRELLVDPAVWLLEATGGIWQN